MWRKVRLLLCSVMFLLIFNGCGKNDKPLTVYIVKNEALYMQAVQAFSEENPELKMNIVTFESYDAMEEQLSTELLSGKGPDVLLFNSRTGTTDPYKLATSNALLPLDQFMGELPSDEYFEQILDAGYINEHQYILPLSWNILQAYSTQERIKERGYNDDIYTSLTTEFQTCMENEEYSASTFQFAGSGGTMNYVMEIAGYEVVDYKTNELVLNKDELKNMAEFLKQFYDNADKNSAISKAHKNDFAWSVEHHTYYVEYFPFVMNLRYYQSVFPGYVNEEMYFAPFTMVNSDKINAQVMQYGAINANTTNKEKAWELLCYILDTTPQGLDGSKYAAETIYYASVNKTSYQANVEEAASTEGVGPKMNVSPLSDENVQILMDLPFRVSSAVVPNNALGNIMQECMGTYLKGEENFESCYAELIRRLELYIGE